MRITDIIKEKSPTFSFEIFPPKKESGLESVFDCADRLCRFSPDFISVTYGAAGGTSASTVKIASRVKQNGITPLAHLTCLSSTREKVREVIASLRLSGIENILALRGDRPREEGFVPPDDFHHASELIAEIRGQGDFCIGGACYPEGHPESGSRSKDLDNLKLKVDSGASFLITQMFFDNAMLYSFISRARKRGIAAPILAGIMPATSAQQLRRMIDLSNAYLPPKFLTLVDRFEKDPAAMEQAGIAYATDQIIDLIANGVDGIHIYAMNKPAVIEKIVANISDILDAARRE